MGRGGYPMRGGPPMMMRGRMPRGPPRGMGGPPRGMYPPRGFMRGGPSGGRGGYRGPPPPCPPDSLNNGPPSNNDGPSNNDNSPQPIPTGGRGTMLRGRGMPGRGRGGMAPPGTSPSMGSGLGSGGSVGGLNNKPIPPRTDGKPVRGFTRGSSSYQGPNRQITTQPPPAGTTTQGAPIQSMKRGAIGGPPGPKRGRYESGPPNRQIPPHHSSVTQHPPPHVNAYNSNPIQTRWVFCF